jgi:hypothetical protein
MDGQGATNPLAVPLKIGTLIAFLFMEAEKENHEQRRERR